MQPLHISQIQNKFIKNLLVELKNIHSIIITTHINADLDGFAASIALKRLLVQLLPEKSIKLIIPQLNQLSEYIGTSYDLINEVEKIWPISSEVMIIVDTNNIEQIDIPQDQKPNFLQKLDSIIIIDHHILPNKLDNKVVLDYIISETTSSSELILDLYICTETKLDKKVAELILMGIISDTANFRFANTRSIENVSYLLNQELNLRETIAKMNLPISRSEKIAKLKAAMRIETLSFIKDYIIIISNVSSFEASASKGLIDLGADICFIIVKEKNKQFRISARASEEIISQDNFHLGQFLSIIGEKFEGSGGGHDGAAGCKGIYKSENFLQEISKVILNQLSEFFSKK